MDELLKRAYITATKAGNECAIVSIHISTDFVDRLRDVANWNIGSMNPETMFGYPLIIEKDWEPLRIEVHAITRIR